MHTKLQTNMLAHWMTEYYRTNPKLFKLPLSKHAQKNNYSEIFIKSISVGESRIAYFLKFCFLSYFKAHTNLQTNSSMHWKKYTKIIIKYSASNLLLWLISFSLIFKLNCKNFTWCRGNVGFPNTDNCWNEDLWSPVPF